MIWYDLVRFREGERARILKQTTAWALKRYCEQSGMRPVRVAAAYDLPRDDRGLVGIGIAVELEPGEASADAISPLLDTIQYQPGTIEMLDALRA